VRLFPKFKDALMERSKIFLDEGAPERAKNYLEMLLKMDRDYPELSDWLVVAHTHDKRKWKAQTEEQDDPVIKGHLGGPADGKKVKGPHSQDDTSASGKNKIDISTVLRERSNFYTLLGLSVDFASEDELKKAYRVLSRQTHPDKHGGNDNVFTVVAK